MTNIISIFITKLCIPTIHGWVFLILHILTSMLLFLAIQANIRWNLFKISEPSFLFYFAQLRLFSSVKVRAVSLWFQCGLQNTCLLPLIVSYLQYLYPENHTFILYHQIFNMKYLSEIGLFKKGTHKTTHGH